MPHASLPGLTLRYELAGRGPSLVLIHELGGALESFDAILPHLAPTFRVLRYDQRGAGLSEKPRASFTMADHCDDLARLLAAIALPSPFRLVGVAAGAAVAATFALGYPGCVAAIALCAPALRVVPERRAYLIDRSAAASAGGMRAIVDAALANSYPDDLRADRAAFEAYRALFLANDPVAYGHANMALAGTQVADELGGLAAPCLVLAGRHDLLRPPDEVAALASGIQGTVFEIVESGHLMQVQAPEALARRLESFFTDAPVPPAGDGR